jgi:hypothetical protein
MTLPMLDAMTPAFAAQAAPPTRRMIAIETNQGILPQNFFPEKEGRDYATSPYLKILKQHQGNMTVFSGVSHPEVDGGHQAEACFLTAAPHPGRGGFRNTISLDQYAAERIGHRTRFPSLVLSVGTRGSISYTGAGVQIPGYNKPSDVFRRMFVQGSPREVEAQLTRLRQGRSILDSVGQRAKTLQNKVGPGDREKLDQYFTGVRELEQRLHKAQDWEIQPKPKIDAEAPKDINDPAAFIESTRAMFDIAQLAIRSDSTRLISIYTYQNSVKLNLPGVDEGTHPLTHHGNRPEKLAQLQRIESAQFVELARLLDGLRDTAEEDDTLLDRTMVLYGTPMGNANAHSNTNLPVLLAGGGFRHGQLLRFDTDNNYPLPNLFVSMLQRMNVETDRFATSTGTMTGLELA